MIPCWLTDTITSDLDRALHYTLLWGLEGAELRTVGSGGDRVPYVNEAKLKRRLAESEMPVVAVVPGMFEGSLRAQTIWLNEIVAFEETLQFCVRIGCPRVVVSAFGEDTVTSRAEAAEALQRAGRLAARRGVVLAVLNEEGMAHATGHALAELLEAAAHPSVRAAWSPAAALRAGEDPSAGLASLVPWVELVRCADVRRDGTGWEAVLPGEGAVGWAAQLAQLAERGFDGPISLEMDVEPRPKNGLHAATALIEMIRHAGRR